VLPAPDSRDDLQRPIDVTAVFDLKHEDFMQVTQWPSHITTPRTTAGRSNTSERPAEWWGLGVTGAAAET
jgi:hypothetical protein